MGLSLNDPKPTRTLSVTPLILLAAKNNNNNSCDLTLIIIIISIKFYKLHAGKCYTIIIAVVTLESSKAMQIKAIMAILAESCMIKTKRTGSYVYTYYTVHMYTLHITSPAVNKHFLLCGYA